MNPHKCPYMMCVSREGSDKTTQMHWLSERCRLHMRTVPKIGTYIPIKIVSQCVGYTSYTRVIFYVRREVDLMKTAKVNAYIMHIFGKIELLSIHAT